MKQAQPTRIKICGIRSVEDAELAVECGATYLGLILAPSSPRLVSLEEAREIVRRISGRASLVAVFKDAPLAQVLQTIQQVPVDLVQLHGAESPDYCSQIPRYTVKTIELPLELIKDSPEPLLEKTLAYEGKCKYLLFDRPKGTDDKGWLPVATARVFEIAERLPPYFFAGGLSSENVGLVVNMLRPFAVDVASGVESAPGVKDAVRVKKFCQNVLGFREGVHQ